MPEPTSTPHYLWLVDSFFAGADAFRRERGMDPAAVVIPDWALHAMISAAVMGASLRWPTPGMPYPKTFFGLPVVGIGDDFVFFGHGDKDVAHLQNDMPTEWPWTSMLQDDDSESGLGEA